MLIINDFFKRRKEAVSNQMESILKKTGGSIVAATRFMNQKPFQKNDRKDKIYIYSPFIYQIVLFFSVLFCRTAIHIFEEEPNRYKRWLLNSSKKNIYVSMYREPFKEYAEHLKKYKKLTVIFVEIEDHKQKLIEFGIEISKIFVSPTPAKVARRSNTKIFNPHKVNLLFASWNNKEGNPLYERGLIYLLDLLQKNKNFHLTILLRDNETKEFLMMVENRNLKSRVKLIDVKEKNLAREFDNCDFVVYPIQKRITKDIPNSLLDGLSRGKPIMISTIFGLSKVVKKAKIGYLIEPNTPAIEMNITSKEYMQMSKRAYLFSEKYTEENYTDVIVKGYMGGSN